jgi:hypothetical protein
MGSCWRLARQSWWGRLLQRRRARCGLEVWQHPPTGEELGQHLLLCGRQSGHDPGTYRHLLLTYSIAQQVADNGTLLGLAKPLTHEGQDQVFFAFEVIFVLNTQADHVTQNITLHSRREGRLGRDHRILWFSVLVDEEQLEELQLTRFAKLCLQDRQATHFLILE